MTPEMKAEWLAALRSGNYDKGRRTLKQKIDETDIITHCCLGVLCEVIDLDYPEIMIGYDEILIDTGNIPSDIYSTVIPPKMREKIGLSPETMDELVTMNDDETNPKSFLEIADWIEKNL